MQSRRVWLLLSAMRLGLSGSAPLARAADAEGERYKGRIAAQKREQRAAKRLTLEGEALRTLPGAMGDPFRALGLMPGVASPLGCLPLCAIRGASPGMSGYYLDGMRLPSRGRRGIKISYRWRLRLSFSYRWQQLTRSGAAAGEAGAGLQHARRAGRERLGGSAGAAAQGVIDVIQGQLTLTAGLRADVYHAGGVTLLGVDPRAQLHAQLTEFLRLRISAGCYQPPPCFPLQHAERPAAPGGAAGAAALSAS